MCGIVGILRFDDRPVEQDDLTHILDKQKHRGKDSVGVALSSRERNGNRVSQRTEVGLAHRRLSIIDLSPAAAQPMSYADGKLWITFNGEIYNYLELRDELIKRGYTFRTHSDTEVILAAYRHWGDSCVNHFNGMFAFALWDEEQGRLFCARDPIGIKPLYFFLSKDFFACASESGALSHLSGKELDRDALAAYLLGMYVPGSLSIYKGIHKLLPGHLLIVTAEGKKDLRRYWQVKEFEEVKDRSSHLKKVKDLLTAAVQRQLRSDVPVGAFLSGGVDSSLVVALASLSETRLHTFSVGFEGQDLNELPYARNVAEKYETVHHELFVSQTMVIDNLNKALSAMNEPVADPAIVPTYMLCKMASEEGVKVLLNGAGGDEVFGGYNRYIVRGTGRYLFDRLMQKKISPSMAGLFTRVFGPRGARLFHQGIDLMLSTGGSLNLTLAMMQDKNDYIQFLRYLSEKCLPEQTKNVNPLYAKMLFDLTTYLPDEILVLLDQMTMAWTLEGRVPFLDVDVVREAFRLEAREHVRGSRTKVFLRELSREGFGIENSLPQKQGFGGPVNYWVNNQPDAIFEVVETIRQVPYLENIKLDLYLSKRNSHGFSHVESSELFRLYCLAYWYRNHKEIA